MPSTNKLTFPTAQLVLDFPSQESGVRRQAGPIEHGRREGHKERPSIALTSFSGSSRSFGQVPRSETLLRRRSCDAQRKEKGVSKQRGALVQAAQ